MSGCSSVGRQPSMRSSFDARLDALLDVADRFEVLVELDVVAPADLRLEALRVLPHLVENAAIELAARAVADEAIERARRIDLLGRRLGRRRPTTGSSRRSSTGRPRAAARSARCRARGSAPAVRPPICEAMTWSIDVPDADLARIEADGRAGQHVHAAEVRARRDRRRLVDRGPG